MKRLLLTTLFALLMASPSLADPAIKVPMDRRGLHGDRVPCCGHDPSWHGAYYDMTYGAPMALVIPPTAETQTHMGWGVGANYVTPNCTQFSRIYPGGGVSYNRRGFLATPPWPSSTDQFGVYYVRGPWH
jgi:hypothetical protein